MLLVQDLLWYTGLMVACEGEAGGELCYQGGSVSFLGLEGSSRRCLRRISFVERQKAWWGYPGPGRSRGLVAAPGPFVVAHSDGPAVPARALHAVRKLTVLHRRERAC